MSNITKKTRNAIKILNVYLILPDITKKELNVIVVRLLSKPN